MRLIGFDYSRAGLYFITIRVQNGMHLFGELPVRAIVDSSLRGYSGNVNTC